MSWYVAHRIFLNKIRNSELFDVETKEAVFSRIVLELFTNSPRSFEDYGVEHILAGYKEIDNQIYVFQLVKPRSFDKPILGARIVETTKDLMHPFINIIIDVPRQILLVETDTTIFQKPEVIPGRVAVFLTEQMTQHGILCSASEISDGKEFWDKIQELDSVEDVMLEFNAPNFFGSENEVDKMVNETYDETNFHKMKIVLKNKITGLKFYYERFHKHIQRLSEGAGKYVIQGYKGSVKIVLSKATFPFRKNISSVDNDGEVMRTLEEANKLNKENG